VKENNKVAAYLMDTCGTCTPCSEGKKHLCTFQKIFGNHVQGGYSTHVIANQRQLFHYGKADPAFAAVCSCAGITTFSAVKKLGKINSQDKILFIGAGGLGMMAIQLFRKLYPNHPGPVVADVDQSKLETALQLGASDIINFKTDRKKIAGLARSSWINDGFQGVIDFVGSESSFSTGFQFLNRGATFVAVGLFGGSSKLPLPVLPVKEVTIKGSWAGSLEEFKELMDIVKEGAIQHPPITVRPLNEVNDVLSLLRNGQVTGRIVLQVDPQANM